MQTGTAPELNNERLFEKSIDKKERMFYTCLYQLQRTNGQIRVCAERETGGEGNAYGSGDSGLL